MTSHLLITGLTVNGDQIMDAVSTKSSRCFSRADLEVQALYEYLSI
jgi:hypothetical protein